MRNFSLSVVILLAAFALACSNSDTRAIKHKLGDAEITASVKAKLATDAGMRTVTDINVSTTNGVVTLAGEVPGAYESAKAAQLAGTVDGVVKVNNELEVRTAMSPDSDGSRSRQAPRKPVR
jgi:Flp pilus assembly protein TadG